MRMSVKEHKGEAPKRFRFSVVTVSDRCSRGEADDLSGMHIIDMLSENNELSCHATVPDESAEISSAVAELAKISDCIVVTGGTGVSKRDVTVDALRPLFSKELPGFGELFRRLSFDEIGMASIMSGATAGVIGDSVVFCLPGSLPAVRLGMGIIVSEAYHIIKHLRD